MVRYTIRNLLLKCHMQLVLTPLQVWNQFHQKVWMWIESQKYILEGVKSRMVENNITNDSVTWAMEYI